MAQENVQVVRQFNDPYEGTDLMVLIREAVGTLGSDPDPSAVLSWWEQNPSWRHVHPDVEWDTTAVTGVGTKVSGPVEVTAWWNDWTDAWRSYIYRTLEYRDLGQIVLTKTAIEALAIGDVPVEMTVFQLWNLRDDKIAACRVFISESEALEAAALEQGFADS